MTPKYHADQGCPTQNSQTYQQPTTGPAFPAWLLHPGPLSGPQLLVLCPSGVWAAYSISWGFLLCIMTDSIPGLYPLAAAGTSPLVTAKNVHRYYQTSWSWGEMGITLVESYCLPILWKWASDCHLFLKGLPTLWLLLLCKASISLGQGGNAWRARSWTVS